MTTENGTVREATDEDVLDVLRILDAAMLAIDHDTVTTAIDRGDVLVATDDGSVVGVVVTSPRDGGAHVEAIAVRRERRSRGIGRQLMDAATDRNDRLTADFRPEIEPFWASLGFSIERRSNRLWGEHRTDAS